MLPGTTSRRALLSIGALLAVATPWPADAQPQAAPRPTRMIVPALAGTGADLAARLLADGLSRRRGHPIVVDNRPGADTMLAAEAFAQTRPGEALFFSFGSVVTTVPLLVERLPYDPDVDLVPVHAFAAEFFGLFVAATLPVRSVAELVEHVRARPGALNVFASTGGPYLGVRDFLRSSGGLDMVFVNYRASPPALLDLAGGRIHAAVVPITAALPLLREGRIRLLLVTNPTRAPAVPDVPTAAEASTSQLEMAGVLGLYGWRGMPEAARAELARQAQEVLAEPETVARLRGAGMEPRGGGTPAAFAAELAQVRARWAALAREFGARPPG